MSIWEVFAGVGLLINDALAIISVIGSAVMLFSPSKAHRFVEWGVLAFVFGVICQVSMMVTGTMPDEIGIFFRLSPAIVNALFAVTVLFLILNLFRSVKKSPRSSVQSMSRGSKRTR